LALDLRGDTGEAISQLYVQLGFAQKDFARLRSRWATTRANAAADLGLIHIPEATPQMKDDFVSLSWWPTLTSGR
jgi:hypothetical protein